MFSPPHSFDAVIGLSNFKQVLQKSPFFPQLVATVSVYCANICKTIQIGGKGIKNTNRLINAIEANSHLIIWNFRHRYYLSQLPSCQLEVGAQ